MAKQGPRLALPISFCGPNQPYYFASSLSYFNIAKELRCEQKNKLSKILRRKKIGQVRSCTQVANNLASRSLSVKVARQRQSTILDSIMIKQRGQLVRTNATRSNKVPLLCPELLPVVSRTCRKRKLLPVLKSSVRPSFRYQQLLSRMFRCWCCCCNSTWVVWHGKKTPCLLPNERTREKRETGTTCETLVDLGRLQNLASKHNKTQKFGGTDAPRSRQPVPVARGIRSRSEDKGIMRAARNG